MIRFLVTFSRALCWRLGGANRNFPNYPGNGQDHRQRRTGGGVTRGPRFIADKHARTAWPPSWSRTARRGGHMARSVVCPIGGHGYTMAWRPPDATRINGWLYKKLNSIRGLRAGFPKVRVVRPDFRRSVQGVRRRRQKPNAGTFSFGSQGIARNRHLTGELFMTMTERSSCTCRTRANSRVRHRRGRPATST